MTLPDRIERKLILPVPRERVWDAITKPEHLTHWLGMVSDMDFRVGGAIHFTWENERSPYAGRIEVIEPAHRFAFRWPSYAVGHPKVTFATVPSTLVEITLEERAEGTQLTLVESGFASLPQPIPSREVYQDHQQGWQALLTELRTYVQSQMEVL
jgi:uncharacterized protein YndB with AHSA1/START domain